MKRFFGFLLLLSFVQTPFAQDDGDLDITFNSTGIQILAPGAVHDNINCIGHQSDGKIIVGGMTIFTGFNFDIAFARLNPDGSLDTSFGTDGYFIHDFNGESDFIYDMIVLPDDKILACGAYSVTAANTDILLVRLNPDGTLDETFGNNNGYAMVGADLGEDYAKAMLIGVNGNIVVCGSTGVPGFTYTRGLLMGFDSNGVLNNSFGNNGKVVININDSYESLEGITQNSSGEIFAGGISDFNFQYHGWITKYSEDGVLDESFGNAGNIVEPQNYNAYYDIVLSGNSIVACGNYSGGQSGAMLRSFDFNGVLNTSFGVNGTAMLDIDGIDEFIDIEEQVNGQLLVCGTTGSSIFSRDLLVAKYHLDGTLNTDFANEGVFVYSVDSGFDVANGLDIQQDGKILVGGLKSGLDNDMVVVRLLNGDGNSIGENEGHLALEVYPNPCKDRIFIKSNVLNRGSVKILDAAGREVLSIQTTGANPIELGDCENGIYNLVFTDMSGKMCYARFVVED